LRRAIVIAAGALVLGAGAAGGFAVGLLGEDTTTVTETVVVTETSTEPAPPSGIPAAVETTRDALLEAAESGDYEALRTLIPESGFEYTFGGPVEGGPIGYWQELERTTDERPLVSLAAILRVPYTLSHGTYVWPFAYSLTGPADVTTYERNLLAPLGELRTLLIPGTGYVGWRAGIEPDGTWVFFVAGD
jgi:hypothetical protein